MACTPSLGLDVVFPRLDAPIVRLRSFCKQPNGAVIVKVGTRGEVVSENSASHSRTIAYVPKVPFPPQRCCHEVETDATVTLAAAAEVKSSSLGENDKYTAYFGRPAFPCRSRITFFTDNCGATPLTFEQTLDMDIDFTFTTAANAGGVLKVHFAKSGRIVRRFFVNGVLADETETEVAGTGQRDSALEVEFTDMKIKSAFQFLTQLTVGGELNAGAQGQTAASDTSKLAAGTRVRVDKHRLNDLGPLP